MSRKSRQFAARGRTVRSRFSALLRGLLAALLGLAAPAAAGLYPPAVLEAESQRLAPLIRATYREIRASIPEFDQFAARDLRLAIPLDGPSPLYFGNRQSSMTVVIPIESVRFLEEFAQLEDIFDLRGCDRTWLQSYAWAVLADRQTLPPPLEAFGINPDAAADTPGGRLASQDVLGPLLQFLIAHEIGHLLQGNQRAPNAPHTLSEEASADAFALDRLAERHTQPGTLDLFFLLERWRDPDGPIAEGGIHPVSPGRLQAISDRLIQERDLFRSFRSGGIGRWQVEMLAYDLSGMARLMSTAQLSRFLPEELGDAFPPSGMESACSG